MKSVDNGAALLDERLPGWRTAVDPDTLKLNHSCNCVLGQIFGDYTKGAEVLGIEGDEPRYGFYRRSGGTWQRLTDAWRKVLASA